MSVFHRYSSTMHGDYRKAYLRSGLVVGVLMALVVLVRLLIGSPMQSPVSLLMDAMLLVVVFILTAVYRNNLPDKKITLKEAMLFGIGLSAVAGVLYGLLLWLIGVVMPSQTELFNSTMNVEAGGWPLSYWAAWWGILSGVTSVLLGSFGAFAAAIFLRNEKSAIKHKQNNKNNN